MREITSLQELKQIELEIMKCIHDFCIKNEIEYNLAFGSLIGAVRHNGFIPWDDDIDICMLRSDYQRFRKEFPTYAKNHGLYVAANDTSPLYLRAMAKVCDERTLLVEPEYQFSEPIGVFVDVFPVDGTPDNKILRYLHIKRIRLLTLCFFAGLKKDEYFTEKRISKKVLRTISKIIGLKRIEKMIEASSSKYKAKPTGYVIASAAWLRSYRFSDLRPVHLAKFEDAEFFIPDNYDSMLRKAYGDYMKLPPEEQRIPHHVMNTYWK